MRNLFDIQINAIRQNAGPAKIPQIQASAWTNSPSEPAVPDQADDPNARGDFLYVTCCA